MNNLEAINIIKDTLQSNVTDPLQQFGIASRNWVHTDLPLLSARYPRLQIRQRGQVNTEIINIGYQFIEKKEIICDIIFYSKVDFKWSDGTSTLKLADVSSHYLHKIWYEGLKPQLNSLHLNHKIAVKPLGEYPPELDPKTQLFSGIVTIAITYFKK